MSCDIAGIGSITAIGGHADEVFEALCAGRSGLDELHVFDRTRFRQHYAYEVDDRPDGQDVPGRATRLLGDAIAEAAGDAGLGSDLSDVPVLIGSGLRELRSAEIRWRGGTRIGEAELDFTEALRDRFGATDVHTFANACSASLHALALGTDLLDQGAETVVVAGVDVLAQSMFGLMERVHPEPPDQLRPFDRDRKGVLLGEGAAAVVLRRRDVHGAVPRGRIRGVEMNCDAYHATAPDRTGIAAAIRDAHQRAGVGPQDVELVLLHGTGTLLNDEVEATAVADAFGPHIGGPLMTGVKSVTGHTAGASGLINLVVAVQCMDSGRVPPVLGLRNPVDESADFRFVTGAARAEKTSLAQVNAFGFGGVNAVVLVEGVR